MSCRLGGGVVGAACSLGGNSWSGGVVGCGRSPLLAAVCSGSVSESASNELWSTMGERGCVCVGCVDSGCVVVGDGG